VGAPAEPLGECDSLELTDALRVGDGEPRAEPEARGVAEPASAEAVGATSVCVGDATGERVPAEGEGAPLAVRCEREAHAVGEGDSDGEALWRAEAVSVLLCAADAEGAAGRLSLGEDVGEGEGRGVAVIVRTGLAEELPASGTVGPAEGVPPPNQAVGVSTEDALLVTPRQAEPVGVGSALPAEPGDAVGSAVGASESRGARLPVAPPGLLGVGAFPERLTRAESVGVAPLEEEGDGRGEREAEVDALSACDAEGECVEEGDARALRDSVGDRLMDSGAEGERVAPAEREGEEDTGGDRVGGPSVTRCETVGAAVGAPPAETLEEGDGRGETLSLVEPLGEREGAGEPLLSADADGERESRGVPEGGALRLPPHTLGFQGGRGSAEGPLRVAVGKGCVEGNAGSVGAGGAVPHAVGAFAVLEGTADMRSGSVRVTLHVSDACGDREVEAQGDAAREAEALAESEESSTEGVGGAVALGDGASEREARALRVPGFGSHGGWSATAVGKGGAEGAAGAVAYAKSLALTVAAGEGEGDARGERVSLAAPLAERDAGGEGLSEGVGAERHTEGETVDELLMLGDGRGEAVAAGERELDGEGRGERDSEPQDDSVRVAETAVSDVREGRGEEEGGGEREGSGERLSVCEPVGAPVVFPVGTEEGDARAEDNAEGVRGSRDVAAGEALPEGVAEPRGLPLPPCSPEARGSSAVGVSGAVAVVETRELREPPRSSERRGWFAEAVGAPGVGERAAVPVPPRSLEARGAFAVADRTPLALPLKPDDGDLFTDAVAVALTASGVDDARAEMLTLREAEHDAEEVAEWDAREALEVGVVVVESLNDTVVRALVPERRAEGEDLDLVGTVVPEAFDDIVWEPVNGNEGAVDGLTEVVPKRPEALAEVATVDEEVPAPRRASAPAVPVTLAVESGEREGSGEGVDAAEGATAPLPEGGPDGVASAVREEACKALAEAVKNSERVGLSEGEPVAQAVGREEADPRGKPAVREGELAPLAVSAPDAVGASEGDKEDAIENVLVGAAEEVRAGEGEPSDEAVTPGVPVPRVTLAVPAFAPVMEGVERNGEVDAPDERVGGALPEPAAGESEGSGDLEKEGCAGAEFVGVRDAREAECEAVAAPVRVVWIELERKEEGENDGVGPTLGEGADERDPDFDTGAERVFEVVAVELAEGLIVIEKEAQLEALLLARAEKDTDTLAVGVDDRLAEADAAAVLLSDFDARAAADGVPALSPVMEGVAPLTENELRWDAEGREGVGATERDGAREALGEPDSVNEGVVVCPSEPDAGALEGERRGELDSDAHAEPLALDLPERLAETAGVGERDNRPLADALGLRLLTPTSQPTMVPLNHVGAKPGVAVPTPLVHVALLLGDADTETQRDGVRVALGERDTAGVRESVSGALSEGDGRGVREGCNEALAAALSVREVESVRVGLLVTASPVRVTLTHAVAVVERLTDTLTRAERDEEGEPVSEKLLVSHTLRVMLRVCVRVSRGDAESEDARLGEGLDVGEADADRQRLPVAEDSGERDASGEPEKEPDTDVERDARDAVAIAVRVPPHMFGPRSGGRNAPPAGRGAPVARGENVAVANAGAEGAAGSVGAGASVGAGSSEKLTTSQKVAGAFAVKVPTGVLERDAATDEV
jgi:hypothetical protein